MKIQEVKRILTRWQPSSFTLYREVFTQYGGSINMHPDIVDYFMKRHNWHFKFFHYKEDDKIKGAYFICNDQNIGILTRRTFPLSSDEILIPMAPDLRCFLPDRTNRLSALHQPQIRNAIWKLTRKKQNCLVKEAFSSKFEKTRRNEYQRFLKKGGSVKSVADCSSDELTHIFIELFRFRFGNTSSCYPADNLANFFSQLHHLLFGHILYIEGIPCAFDIVLKSESQMNIYFDVSNGAIKNECRPLSPGSILMWLNISRARHYCQERQKKLLFSIGILKPEWEYKRMWSPPYFTGKSIC
ncbi:antimicrobial resistance protein Mig-14 [Salmonella enterica]|nr:antimicrobial resistance protein Mig-14 [Salmonella enterica]EAQ9429007.1 antimicrobial resistance protein Mig-14 [Salmonella enterica]EBA3019143.1 antimicrobial resistance protein Mig-14 [Salmonella enterica]ECZ3817571.1 antimicrobial resistance protein Mig-14 [Salmonella enterica]EGK2184419.1 antimicrobial resistance protein Mig-14 [Salmonella enterica]